MALQHQAGAAKPAPTHPKTVPAPQRRAPSSTGVRQKPDATKPFVFKDFASI